jgi:hypothetical protein
VSLVITDYLLFFQSKEPLLIYDFNCQYNVQWYTEHACCESVITSDTCRSTQEDRNIDIDLSPLTHDPGILFSR